MPFLSGYSIRIHFGRSVPVPEAPSSAGVLSLGMLSHPTSRDGQPRRGSEEATVQTSAPGFQDDAGLMSLPPECVKDGPSPAGGFSSKDIECRSQKQESSSTLQRANSPIRKSYSVPLQR